MSGLTVFLIRSQSPNWDGLRNALVSLPDVALVGETCSADRARELIPALRPALIASAIDVEGVSAVPLLKELRAQLPTALIVVFAGRYTVEELVDLVAVRASGYLLWDDLDSPGFAAAHDAVRSGAFTVVSQAVASAFADAVLARHETRAAVGSLTGRQRAVMRMIAAGQTNQEIATHLGIQSTTVATHVERLKARFGAASRSELAALMLSSGPLE